MGSQVWSFSKLDAAMPPASSPHSLAGPPEQPYFADQPAEVSLPQAQSYPPHHLLTIPLEIRSSIWEIIHKDIKDGIKSQWWEKPETDYDNLTLVCRAIYHEISRYWRRAIIPRHRLASFICQPLSKQIRNNFRQLAIEVPLNCSMTFFANMYFMLTSLSGELQDLKIFFTGTDAYGTRVYLHGCGNEPPSADSRAWKLPVDGQDFRKRSPLFLALKNLTELRTLVLSNSNFAYLQQLIIQNKRKLRKLFIVDDPRASLTNVHWRECMRAGTPVYGLYAPVTQNFPPVKALHIGANAALISVQVVNKLSPTLESLTWIVPDLSRQSGGFRIDWYRDTEIILSTLRANSKQLHTLRICFEGAIYEAQPEYGNLINGFRQHLSYIASLRVVELHFWSKSPYIAGEFLESLPSRVKRLYLADRFVSAQALMKFIRSRYPSKKHWQPGYSACMQSSIGLRDGAKDLDTKEEVNRDDYVYLDSTAIAFVGYEYTRADGVRVRIVERQDSRPDLLGTQSEHNLTDIESATCASKDLPASAVEQRLELLKLNGRLLDREHNQHLAFYQYANHIAPRDSSGKTISYPNLQHLSTTLHNSVPGSDADGQAPHAAIEAAVAQLKPPSIGEIRTNRTILSMSPLTDDNTYFGHEMAASKVFELEAVARIDELSPRKWCEEVVVGKDWDHWQSELD